MFAIRFIFRLILLEEKVDAFCFVFKVSQTGGEQLFEDNVNTESQAHIHT